MLHSGDAHWVTTTASGEDEPTLSALFHRLNNHLGIILANAELLEAKAADEASRKRASHVIASALDAMTSARDVRALVLASLHTHES